MSNLHRVLGNSRKANNTHIPDFGELKGKVKDKGVNYYHQAKVP